MAFNPEEFIKSQTATLKPPTTPAAGGFDPDYFLKTFSAGPLPPSKEVTKLTSVAEGAGLQEKTQEILQPREAPKSIFSGGLLSDVFDTMNLLQHGVTGVIQGKGFSEGVRTRASFTDEESFKNAGIMGTILGLGLDIAVDPLTYINPLAALGKIGKVLKIAEPLAQAALKTKSVFGKTKAGNLLGQAFIYRFGQDPIYKKIAERTLKNIAIGNQNLIELVKPIAKLDSDAQRAIAAARKAGKLEDLPADLLAKAKPAFDELDNLGKQAVGAGLLKKEIYDENVGKYIARLYEKFEKPSLIEKVKGFISPKKPLRIDLDRFMKRGDISDEVRSAMGEILEAGYPTAKALVQLKTAVENANFFKQVASKFALEGAEDIPKGFTKLATTPRLGALSGRHVPDAIARDINEIVRVKTTAEKIAAPIVAGFKFGKVVLNPATHARNIASNFILNHFEGLSPLRLDIYGEAAKELATKGKWYQEAKQLGLGLDTYASQEIKSMLKGPEIAGLEKITSGAKKAMDTISDIYQKEEEFAKMAQYIFQRKAGKTAEEAWQIAERATFNYAQVTPFIRRIRESIFGYPFITFTYKATPQIVKTALTKPTKISNIGKIKQAIESMSDLKELERERASEPDWVRDGFYVKLPIKDKHGRSAYIDLSYILPFGDLISGQFVERGIKRETGLPEGPGESLLRKTPLLNLIREVGKNQDFYGNKIWKESDTVEKQMADLFRHLMKTYLPPAIADQIPGGIRAGGERRPGTIQRVVSKELGIEEGGAQTRTPIQELLRQVGIKVSPVDIEAQEKFFGAEKEKALETLLEEQGLIRKFEKAYVPKK